MNLPGASAQILHPEPKVRGLRQPTRDPISAVTDPAPYRFYRELVGRHPLYFDERLGFWVASGAGVVEAILQDSAFSVRPLEEPVPTAIKGTRAADIFARLVRMRDGGAQRPLKQAICKALTPVDLRHLTTRSEDWTHHLLQLPIVESQDETAPDITFRLPIYAVGSLLGVPSDHLPQTVHWMNDFARCLAPGSNPQQVEQGRQAAESLWDLFYELLQQAQFPCHRNPLGRPLDQGLLSSFARSACRHLGHDEGLIIANAIGFLSQSYEATAGLIGNSLVALARRPGLAEAVGTDPDLLEAVIREVTRFDPPIQNTRRFAAVDSLVAGEKIKAGEAVLLVLAAANRDVEVNPDPGDFNPRRVDPVVFTFSAGAHLCPGNEMAIAMTKGALLQLLASKIDLDALTRDFHYRPSQNARVPLLNWDSVCV